MAEITLKNLKKIYPSGTLGAEGVNLSVSDGKFLVLCGGQGSGKSSVMRMICGLEDVTEGELYIDGVLMNDVQPKDRDVAVIMQNIPLYPHLTVYDNIGYSLSLRKLPKAEIDARVKEAAEIMGLTSCLLKKPKNLSSLERQRAFLARSIARRPKIIMADEPVKGLDEGLKIELRSDMLKLSRSLGVNFIVATRSFVDAVMLADKIVYMEKGKIVQTGTPSELYDKPLTLGCATYFGRPKINILDGVIENGAFVGGGISLPIAGESLASYEKSGKKLYLAVRSEDIRLGEGFEVEIDGVDEESKSFSFTLAGVYHFSAAKGEAKLEKGEKAKLCFDKKRTLFYDFEAETLID